MFGILARRFTILGPMRWSTGAAAAVVTPSHRGLAGRAPSDLHEAGWDLVRDGDAIREAGGRVMHLFGQVLDFDGHPLPGVTVEIWQRGPDGQEAPEGPAGAGQVFTGYGALRTDRFGGYRFRTILPVGDEVCPPHIEARLTPPRGRVLTTRLYLLDDPRNESDWHFASLGPSRQAAVTFDPVDRADGELEAGFNFVL